MRPVPGRAQGVQESTYDDFRIVELGAPAPGIPYVRNYFKNERLFSRLEPFLVETIRRERIDVIHAQHVLTCVPSVRAATRTGVPSVCTVRDYWPVCYWSDLLHTNDEAALCPECTAAGMSQCIRPRAGPLWPLAVPMIPYMRGNLARKRSGLAAAAAIVAVSSTMAADLRSRAPELAGSNIVTIPNPVDIAGLRERAAAASPGVDGPYALYVGKLAPNKGTSHLVEVLARSELDWPLVIAGDGPDRTALEAAARQSSRAIQFLGWQDQNRVAALLANASMLIFPSRGPESLSRVLIEASALGVPIAAMNTGGTADIVVDNETGLLSRTPEELAGHVRQLREDAALRERLGTAARKRAATLFDAPAVVARVEAVYRQVAGLAA